jgi:hypothetical protein
MPTNISLYDSKVFSSLPNFRTASHSLEGMSGSLSLLGKVICRHNLQEHIGVSLLHKHFPISRDEQLIKYFVGNCSYIRPYPRSTNENVVPYLWKFDCDRTTGLQSFYPLEFVDTGRRAFRGRTDARKLLSSEMFLAEFSATLHALDLRNVLGLCTNHGRGEIVLGDGEILVETTDHVHRVLTLAPVAKKSIEAVETSWLFLPEKCDTNIPNCQIICVSHCRIHSE